MIVAMSCAGEGFGHAARLAVFGRELAKRHQVHFFVPASVRGFLEDKFPGFTCHEIPHFHFSKRRGRIIFSATLLENLPKILTFPYRVGVLAQKLKQLKVRAVISDFDPYLSTAGKLAGLKVLQVNHPGVVQRFTEEDMEAWIPGLLARFLEGPWDRRLLVSFFRGDTGPLFRRTLIRRRTKGTGEILFNLKNEYRPTVNALLRRRPDLKARVFPDPQQDFEAALASCRAVVSSSGHQIIAEALRLKKPILVIPQEGQWEQLLNARMLAVTGRGTYGSLETLEPDLDAFLAREREWKQASRRPLPQGFTVEDGLPILLRKTEDFLREEAQFA